MLVLKNKVVIARRLIQTAVQQVTAADAFERGENRVDCMVGSQREVRAIVLERCGVQAIAEIKFRDLLRREAMSRIRADHRDRVV